MASLVALTVGLVVWIVAWSLGVKAFDAMLLGMVFVIPVAAWQVFGPGLKKTLGLTPHPPGT
jgi:hypothetical protein